MHSITGAILIGGRSSRMGLPKYAIMLQDGRSMLEHVLQTLASVCTEVVLVDGSGALRDGRQRVVIDQRPNLGPLGAIEALLASGIDDEYLICPCDVPLMSQHALEALLQERVGLATILRLSHRAEPESLPARISAAALPAVQRLLDSGQRAVWGLMQALPAEVVSIPADWEQCFANINSPDDLAKLEQ